MIRVLQCVNDMHRAGLETMLMNYYRNIDREKIQFDFLTHRPNKSDYDDEIISMGGKVYYAPRLYPQNYLVYFKFMKRFFSEHPEYKVVHSHIDAMSYLPLLAAKRAGVPYRIAHSHNTSIDKDFKYILKQYFRSQITKVANYYCACGQDAGEFLFPSKNFKIIPNAIEVERFLYNGEIRRNVRKSLGITDELVLGNVGRLSYQKNHRFLNEIFSEVHKLESRAILLLVGVGEKENEIKSQVHDLNLDSNVRFLGNRNDVNQLYQAMDVFVMPSFFEGIPVTGIEAQFANLPCVFSDKVPSEVDFANISTFLPLSDSASVWAKKILDIVHGHHRDEIKKELCSSKYDIRNAKSTLESYYEGFAQECLRRGS